ncbi:MAG TPA: hypothetical protein VGH23_16385 [Rhizomicrobium sp.]|jgi:hypothetical protein
MTIERAYCQDKEHIAAFRAYGLPDKLIYVDGRGAEDLERCLDSFRGRQGKLLVAPDLTVFGDSKKAITETMARLERAKIGVVDVINPQDETLAEMLARAHRRIDGKRFPDRRKAQRRGRLGALAKAQLAAMNRAGIDATWLIRQIVNDPDVTWPTAVRILDGKISESTLRRHYLVTA